ncbi:hypothetical protein BRD18_02330 [Halobacteriales archaeon SW_7_71_33]|nr:MAG: hypothetical protein BRD18_02330 [Halobacteriales archaeon SW_7_71_33]
MTADSYRSALAVVAVALLLVVAGCGEAGDGALPTTEPTATTQTTQATEPTATTSTVRTVEGETEPPFSAERLPPGVETDGSVAVGRLAAAHDEALAGSSFALELNFSRTVTAADGSTRRLVTSQRTRADGNGEFLLRFVNPQAGLQQTTWGNDSTVVSRVVTSETVSYRNADPEAVRANLSARPFVEQFLSVGDYSVAVAGEDRVLLTATEASDDAADRIGEGVSSVDDYRGRVVVDSTGRVRSLSVDADVSLGEGGSATLGVSVALSGLGSTDVERPEWVEEALRQTDGRLVATTEKRGR